MQRQAYPEFEASMVYRVNSRTDRVIRRNPVLKNKNKQTKKRVIGKHNQTGEGIEQNYPGSKN